MSRRVILDTDPGVDDALALFFLLRSPELELDAVTTVFGNVDVEQTTRNALIGFVVLGYAFYWAGKGQAQVVGNKAKFLWQKFPKFVLGFLLISTLATAAFFSKEQIGALANFSRWAFLLTFAGVGLRTNFKALSRQGLKPFAVGAIGEVAIAGFTLGLVLVAQRFFGW